MSDYPLFIPEFMLYTKSSLLWFKITTKLREFRNYLNRSIVKAKTPYISIFTSSSNSSNTFETARSSVSSSTISYTLSPSP